MKKVMLLIMLVSMFCFLPVAGAANMVTNGDFDDGLDGWSNSPSQWHSFTVEDANDTYIRFGWVNYLAIWQTVGTFEADTVYQMDVKAKNWDGACEGIWLQIIDANETPATTLIDSEQWFTYGATNPGPDPNDPYPWEDFSVSIDTSSYPEIVGHPIRIAARISDYAVPWGLYCWMGVTSVSVLPDRPVIVTQPQGTIADPSAAFNIGVASQSPLHYAWYLSDDNVIGGDTAIGTDSDILVLENVAMEDAGKYVYCVVTNEGTSYTATSDLAILDVQRMMGHWKFNDNLLDSTVNGNDGTCPSPAYVSGVEGSAIQFVGDANDLNRVTIGNDTAFNNYEVGLTVSAWVKTTNTGSWQVIVGKRDLDLDDSGWILAVNNNGLPHFSMLNAASANGTSVINDGQWHLVTGTYQGATNEISVYVDGLLDASAVGTAEPPITPAGIPVVIGAEKVDTLAETPFAGQIDDVRIYNYSRDRYEVIDIYNDVVEPDKLFCLEGDSPVLDVTGPEGQPDCKVDLYDFAALALQWMTSGLYPVQ